MKVWARYAVPVMILVDEAQDSIERVVMVPGEPRVPQLEGTRD